MASNSAEEELYLSLLAQVLTRSGFPASYRLVKGEGWRGNVYAPIIRVLGHLDLEVVRKSDPEHREFGRDVPIDAETMIGLRRLADLRLCINDVIADQIPGDLMETGVWRGGASIFMRAVLKVRDCRDRNVWLADSFAGMPAVEPDRYPADKADTFGQWTKIVVPLEEVKANFERYHLLDEQVRFLPGWFEETLKSAPVRRLALLRVDCDLYSSTMNVLEALYDRVSPGGYIIIDDYGIVTCRRAVDDFRARRGLTGELVDIDGAAIRWRRPLKGEED